MTIFNDNAYGNINGAAGNYQLTMLRTHPQHMDGSESLYEIDGNSIVRHAKKIGADKITGAGTFETAMLQALDRVSGSQQRASALIQEAIINPDSVDAHDITIAQAEASMSFNITRNILSRLVQGWRDIINTR
jgi:flagellar hook-basal body complex protein FliE